jgi:hypothetical protein
MPAVKTPGFHSFDRLEKGPLDVHAAPAMRIYGRFYPTELQPGTAQGIPARHLGAARIAGDAKIHGAQVEVRLGSVVTRRHRAIAQMGEGPWSVFELDSGQVGLAGFTWL